MSRKIADHNSRVRMLLFFARPLHIFNILLFVKMWKMMSYAPATFQNHFKGTASQVTQALWRDEFSSYIWYFLIAAVVDVIVVEYLPLIRNE